MRDVALLEFAYATGVRYQLRHAHPRRVREFEQRNIRHRERLVGIGGIKQLLDLGDSQDGGEGSPPFGRLDPFAGIAGGDPLSHQKLEVGANCGDLPADRGGRETQVFEEVNELTELGRGQLLWCFGPARGGVLTQPCDVAQIARYRVAAVASLEGEIIAEPLEVERPSYWGGRRGERRRRMILKGITRTSPPATTASTVLTPRTTRSTSSRSVPNLLTRYVRAP